GRLSGLGRPRGQRRAEPRRAARVDRRDPGYAWRMAAPIERLIEELERSYRETQERLSDPAVYNDHREAAEVGRKAKELEGPYKLAQEWRSTRDDLEAARDDGDLRELVPALEERLATREEDLKLAVVETEAADRTD